MNYYYKRGVNLKTGVQLAPEMFYFKIDIPIGKRGCKHENWGCI